MKDEAVAVASEIEAAIVVMIEHLGQLDAAVEKITVTLETINARLDIIESSPAIRAIMPPKETDA